MKSVILIFAFVVGMSLAEASTKTYTQKEFDEKVEKEVNRQIDMVKKKSISQLTKELMSKEREIIQKELVNTNRAEQLALGEKSLLKKIEGLSQQQKKIIGCMDKNEGTKLMRVKQLVSMIAGMKPQKASDILSVQEASISVKILEKIDPVKASKIFNLMDKEVSARLQKQYLNMQQ